MRVPVAGLAPEVREIELDAETTHYLVRVRRLAPGDAVIAFDPCSKLEADAQLLAEVGNRRGARLILSEVRPSTMLPSREVTLLQCVGKADKMSAVVRDATELGATAIVPLSSSRTVADRASDKAHGRLERVAVEAARQCGRGDCPRIGRVTPIEVAVREVVADFKLVFHPRTFGEQRGASPFAEIGALPNGSVALLVGPEGGLSDEELELARAGGFRAVVLGRFVLRTETVAAAALGGILAVTGEGSGPTSL